MNNFDRNSHIHNTKIHAVKGVSQDNGKTKICMPKPTALMQMIEDEAIEKIAQNIEKRLIMDQAV
ncbi:hypothetical protein ACW2QC_08250 [Virgibacillus sp. FSP13]